MKPGNDSVLALNTSNTLNHAQRCLNSPVVNLKKRTTSCTPPQNASISKRTSLSDVTNTKGNLHTGRYFYCSPVLILLLSSSIKMNVLFS